MVCGIPDTGAQVLCNFVNHLLGNYGATLDLSAVGGFTVGALVQFPNRDPFFHNVFSLFEGKRFDLNGSWSRT